RGLGCIGRIGDFLRSRPGVPAPTAPSSPPTSSFRTRSGRLDANFSRLGDRCLGGSFGGFGNGRFGGGRTYSRSRGRRSNRLPWQDRRGAGQRRTTTSAPTQRTYTLRSARAGLR